MDADQKTRLYSIIAAVLFVVQASYSINLAINGEAMFNLIYGLLLLTFAIILYYRKKNKSLVIISAAMVLQSIYFFSNYVSLYNILFFLMSVSLTLVVFLGIKNFNIAKKIFFIPSLLSLITDIANFYEAFKYSDEIDINFDSIKFFFLLNWDVILNNIARTVSIFFLCLWVTKPVMLNNTNESI
ncbi:MAG: hypothetical protein J1E40_08465 [Oscillospiraceae bacterium]|nr:hypothetical protein [Oscillospiraceae bacterium]